LQKSTLGTTPWRTQGGCVVDARTCGVRLVGIIILSRGRSTERSGGGHGHVAARRSQAPELMSFSDGAHAPCRGCCILAWPNSGWGRERTCGFRHCATRGHGCCVVCRCVRGPFLRQPHQKGPRGSRIDKYVKIYVSAKRVPGGSFAKSLSLARFFYRWNTV
jgi:hypothetical protein